MKILLVDVCHTLYKSNITICNEPFYSSTSIFIIDSENPLIDSEWLDQPVDKIGIKQLRVDNRLSNIPGNAHTAMANSA
ncbi:MAG: hypothetical protein QGH99_09430 [Pseudomonadales bacterium]|nr:hypothetical protein [Gammaproteobacteria bacterium]MDP6025860.1 hypothetical protein [Pseudomonadales bacterium]MDP6315586.1 hypothetical protein [Pseudomonadales bacterium]MDP7316053.1 hypothetical protein [Pseudomonadales bacterium]MDP7577174.1 hypothetical protein [Pseudomonadales bacterium]